MPSDERVVADWKEQPFTSVKKRRETVHHRIRVIAHDGVGVDVQHEVRRQNESEWQPAETYESRPHGIEKITLTDEWWAT